LDIKRINIEKVSLWCFFWELRSAICFTFVFALLLSDCDRCGL